MKLSKFGASFKSSYDKRSERSRQTILSVEERVIKYKQKKTHQQAKNNTKSYQGFGYTYKPFQSNLNK